MAFALLVLILHAAQAGATHFHQQSRALQSSTAGAAASRDAGAQTAPDSGAHTQCLLCRLQRDAASGLRNAGPAVIEPPPAAPRPESSAPDARHRIPPGSAHGRAPPHA